MCVVAGWKDFCDVVAGAVVLGSGDAGSVIMGLGVTAFSAVFLR